MNERQSSLLGLGCDCGTKLGATTPDPVELNKETYRTRFAISSMREAGGTKALATYTAGAVVGKFTEAKLVNNQLWFHSNYGGWFPYIYNNFYYANLAPVTLSNDEKSRILLDIGKIAAPMTAPSVDILEAGAKVTENVVEGATDMAKFLGQMAAQVKWILIVGGVGVGAYLIHKQTSKNKAQRTSLGAIKKKKVIHV